MSKGRAWSALVVVIGVAAVGGALAWHVHARAAADEASARQANCEQTMGYHRRARLLEQLVLLDCSASQDALEELATSSDGKLAIQALSAIGRTDYSAGKAKASDIAEDLKRSDFVRVMVAAVPKTECPNRVSPPLSHCWNGIHSSVRLKRRRDRRRTTESAPQRQWHQEACQHVTRNRAAARGRKRRRARCPVRARVEIEN